MTFDDIMQIVLPSQNDVSPHVTGKYGEAGHTGGAHGGIDFNYEGGQNGINLTHPNIYAPIAGKVEMPENGGRYGIIGIRDSNGYLHQILHTNSQNVKNGDSVNQGQLIGTMGNKGTTAQHIHYQIKDDEGQNQNPETWWDDIVLGSNEQETLIGSSGEDYLYGLNPSDNISEPASHFEQSYTSPIV